MASNNKTSSNLLLVSSHPTTSQQNNKKLSVSKNFLITGAIDNSDQPSTQIFVKIRNGPQWYLGAQGKLIHEKT
jgi:hypothetical protein